MASNLDIERFSARMGMNLVLTRVSGIFRSSTSFPCYDSFSAPKGARKCLSPNISISWIERGLFRVKATSGNTHLGGDDFDLAIIAVANSVRTRCLDLLKGFATLGCPKLDGSCYNYFVVRVFLKSSIASLIPHFGGYQ